MNAEPKQEPLAQAIDDPAAEAAADDTSHILGKSSPLPRRSTRRACRIIFSLFAGLMTSLAIAEVLSQTRLVPGADGRWLTVRDFWTGRTKHVQSYEHRIGTNTLVYSRTNQGYEPEVSLLWTIPEVPLEDPRVANASYDALLAGWPVRCVWGATSSFDLGLAYIGRPQANIDVHKVSLAGRKFPTGILWPGLIANTALYGAIWFGLLLTPGAIRRARRRRRGLCPYCGYSLADLPPDRPCPECGAATAPVSLPR